MNNLFDNSETIVACSTNLNGASAIAVVRFSGEAYLSKFNNLFSTDLLGLNPRKATFCKILIEDKIFDEVLVTFFPGPRSYTGEDCLEVALHGNPVLVKGFLRHVTENYPCRFAKPGEFTIRALRNNKMTFSQVEGLELLLSAASLPAISQGLSLMSGELHKSYESLYKLYLELRGAIEIVIDFSDDVGEEESLALVKSKMKDFSSHVDQLAKKAKKPYSSILNPSVSFFGPANAGKSSLFNLLLDEDRSIVTNIAGTTRDYVSEYLDIDGHSFRLIDTAGVRATDDVVELAGIDSSKKISNESFYKVLVLNIAELSSYDLTMLERTSFDCVVLTHVDLLEGSDGKTNDAVREVLKLSRNFTIGHYFFCSTVTNKIYGSLTANEITESSIRGSIGPESESGSIGPESKSGSIGPGSESGSIGPGSESGSIGPESESGSIGPESERGSIGPESESGSIGPESESGSIGPNSEICSNIPKSLGFHLEQKILESFKLLILDDPIMIERQRSELIELQAATNRVVQVLENMIDVGIVSHEINGLDSILSNLIGVVYPDDILDHTFANFCIGK